VVQLSELFESRVVLLRVLEPKKQQPPAEAERAEAQAQLHRLAGLLGKKGIEAAGVVREGEPTEEILKAAEDEGADLIAMTTHGRGGLTRALTGSVTESILRKAKIPLLVTRNAAAPAKSLRPGAAKVGR
jgi:nucleotide-binding universal stress UspA family protein